MDNTDIIVYISLGFLLLLCVLIQIKNTIVSYHVDKAIEIIFTQPNYLEFAAKHLPDGYYEKNLFHPLKWTFNSMFPGLSVYKKD